MHSVWHAHTVPVCWAPEHLETPEHLENHAAICLVCEIANFQGKFAYLQCAECPQHKGEGGREPEGLVQGNGKQVLTNGLSRAAGRGGGGVTAQRGISTLTPKEVDAVGYVCGYFDVGGWVAGGWQVGVGVGWQQREEGVTCVVGGWVAAMPLPSQPPCPAQDQPPLAAKMPSHFSMSSTARCALSPLHTHNDSAIHQIWSLGVLVCRSAPPPKTLAPFTPIVSWRSVCRLMFSMK